MVAISISTPNIFIVAIAKPTVVDVKNCPKCHQYSDPDLIVINQLNTCSKNSITIQLNKLVDIHRQIGAQA